MMRNDDDDSNQKAPEKNKNYTNGFCDAHLSSTFSIHLEQIMISAWTETGRRKHLLLLTNI